MVKRTMVVKKYAIIRRGRPKVRWINQVVEDMNVIDVKGCGTMVKSADHPTLD